MSGFNLNRVQQAGNLVRDPEVREVGDGKVTNFTIAVNRPKSDGVDFLDIAAWGAVGASVAEYKKKGDPVFVEGSIRVKDYEDQEGKKRYRYQIQASSVQFLPTRGENSGGNGGGNSETDVSDIPF